MACSADETPVFDPAPPPFATARGRRGPVTEGVGRHRTEAGIAIGERGETTEKGRIDQGAEGRTVLGIGTGEKRPQRISLEEHSTAKITEPR